MRKNRQIRRGKSRQFQTVDFNTEEISGRDDSFDECLAEFLDVLKYERNRAAGTIEFYRKELGKFRQSFEEQRLKTNLDRKSTRLNSSHVAISYAVFCLKKKTQRKIQEHNIKT